MISKTDLISRMKNIMCIIFDVDDTLIKTSNAQKIALGACLELLNKELLSKNDKEIITIDKLYVHIKRIQEQRRVCDVGPCVLKELLKKLGYDPRGKENLICRMHIKYNDLLRENLELYPDVIPFFEKINAQEKTLAFGVVSDGDTYIQREKLIRTNIIELFASTTISADIGVQKPDLKIFKEALEDVGADTAENAVYVGDRLDKDIRGAKKAGILAIRILRKDGKYYHERPKSTYDTPDYEINSLYALLELFD